jgi:hypothetical protein
MVARMSLAEVQQGGQVEVGFTDPANDLAKPEAGRECNRLNSV